MLPRLQAPSILSRNAVANDASSPEKKMNMYGKVSSVDAIKI